MVGGGSYKGNNRGKAYGIMLILAFGAALLGVLVIHKLREKRIFNLLLQDKDRQLLSLQLLLQREREYTKEMKRKTEEMKAKIYSLRNLNMESNRRILEMQSTIDSLKDEQKILESALKERLNEIKMNRERVNIDQEKENPQITALTERLKQKEAEIEDLKRSLAKSFNESAHYVNGVNSARGNGSDNGSTRITEGEHTAIFENTSESKESLIDKEQQESREEHSKTLENPLEGLRDEDATVNGTLDNGQGSNKGNLQDKSSLDAKEGSNITNATKGRVLQTGNDDTGMKLVNGQEGTVARDEQLGLENSQQDQGHDQGTFKSGLKLEVTDNSTSSSFRVKERHAKEKRWKKLARSRRSASNRNHENNEDMGIRKRKFSSNNQKPQRDREKAITYNGKESSDEVRQYESQENGGIDFKIQQNAGKLNPIEEESPEETEAADMDHETNGATGELYRDLVSDFEENKEEYNEDTEESEF